MSKNKRIEEDASDDLVIVDASPNSNKKPKIDDESDDSVILIEKDPSVLKRNETAKPKKERKAKGNIKKENTTKGKKSTTKESNANKGNKNKGKQQECEKETTPTRESQSIFHNEEKAKYTVVFKAGSFEKNYYLNDEDPIEFIYKDLFGEDTQRKLLYEEMKLSRMLLANECGFFPGLNYIYLPENESLDFIKKDGQVLVKFSEDPADDILIPLSNTLTRESIVRSISEACGKDISKKVIVYNGEVVDFNNRKELPIEDGDILDIFGEEKFKIDRKCQL